MKNFTLLILTLFLGFSQIHAQCPANALAVDCDAGPINFFATSATDCVFATDCSTLVSEYFIVSTGDTVILGTTPTTSFDPTLYEGQCVSVQPVCYDLATVQVFVDRLNNSFANICCTTVDSQTPPELDPICGTVTSIYTSGDQVQNMDDVLNILAAFGGDTLTLRGFASVVDDINVQAPAIGAVCTGVDVIGYCLNTEIDFTANAYDICPAVCPADLILTGTTANPLYPAGNTITSDASIPATTNVGYQAGMQILLNPPFQALPDAEFGAEIIPCVPE